MIKMFQNSIFLSGIKKIFEKISDKCNESLIIWFFSQKLFELISNVFKNSMLYSFFKNTFEKISVKWNESQIGWYVTRNLDDNKSHNSFFYRFINFLINKTFSINLKGVVGEKIKSSSILNILSHYEIGVYLMLLILPIAPTMVCVAVAVFTILSFFIKSIVKNNLIIKIDAFVFSTIILLGAFLVYSVSSYSILSSIKVFMVYAVFIIFMFLTISCGSNKKNFNIMIVLFSISGLIVSLYGIYQKFFGNNQGHAWVDTSMFSDISMRVYSTFGNPNVFGQYLLILIPLCAAMIYASKHFMTKLYYFIVMSLGCVCMLLTHSRGCWIGLILTFIIFVFFVDKRLLIFICAAFLLMPFIMPESIIHRFASIGDMGDSSTSYRVSIWMGTLKMLKDYWLIGVGVGNEAFNKVYPFYSLEAAVAAHSHNFYLQVFSELGLTGIITFFITIFIALKKILVGYIVGKKNKYSLICAGIFAGVLGLMVEGFFDYVWYNFRFFAIFWLIFGIGIASRRCACDENFTRYK